MELVQDPYLGTVEGREDSGKEERNNPKEEKGGKHHGKPLSVWHYRYLPVRYATERLNSEVGLLCPK